MKQHHDLDKDVAPSLCLDMYLVLDHLCHSTAILQEYKNIVLLRTDGIL